MLFAYEVRVLLVYLHARWLARRELRLRAGAQKAALDSAGACAAAHTATGVMHTDLIRAGQALRAVERQQAVEERWVRVAQAAEDARARYERLDGRTGRTVPGLIGTLQAWICAAALTWHAPNWVADLVALFR